jgi:hypothetical protein
MYALILTLVVVWEIVIYCLLRNQSCRYNFLLKRVAHNIQTEKIGVCRILLSHYYGLAKDIKKTLNTAVGSRSLPLYVIIYYKCI